MSVTARGRWPTALSPGLALERLLQAAQMGQLHVHFYKDTYPGRLEGEAWARSSGPCKSS